MSHFYDVHRNRDNYHDELTISTDSFYWVISNKFTSCLVKCNLRQTGLGLFLPFQSVMKHVGRSLNAETDLKTTSIVN